MNHIDELISLSCSTDNNNNLYANCFNDLKNYFNTFQLSTNHQQQSDVSIKKTIIKSLLRLFT